MISISLDGRLFSLNKATGEMVWERKVADPAIAETLTLAPLVVRDLAIVGNAGGEFGIRGWIDATDLNTGKQVWRTYTIPGAGEPGNETWKDGKERWKHGGGSVWETATYDPESDTFYQGIGNAGPDWDPEYRPGDNKWAASVLALSPSDGKIKWGYQYTPNDPYDFDEISEHPIINAKVNGEDRKLVVHAARNGFYYALDRTNGSFVAGKQYVDELNWTPGLDPKTGRPLNYNPNTDVQEYAPGSHGSRAPTPKAGDCAPRISAARTGSPPPTIPSSTCSTFPRSRAATTSRPWSRRTLSTRVARSSRASGSPAAAYRPTERLYGSLKALDPTTGETKVTAEARISELQRRAGDRRQPGVPRPCDGTLTRRTTPRPCRRSGASTPAPASTRRRSATPSTASSTSPCWWARASRSSSGRTSPELKNTSTASMLYVFGL